MVEKTKKIVASSKKAAVTNTTKGSLVLCEVKIDGGDWISPNSCQIFYIEEDSKFPEITYEIKTSETGPFDWSWKIEWIAMGCSHAANKPRYKNKSQKIFSKSGAFKSNDTKWKANLGEVLGGILTVKVKTSTTTFLRQTIILGKNPSKEQINKEIDSSNANDVKETLKKIIQQESAYKHFYSDNMPMTSFDNGFGLGQLTNPPPTYEQVWSWKAHIRELLEKRLPAHRKRAQNYLDKHGQYTSEQLELETLAAYNGLAKGQHYWNWSESQKKWVENNDVICDPNQSNKGWLVSTPEEKKMTVKDLQEDKDKKPFYTGRCYAEHIKNAQ
jgi:hypothetical protein